MSLGAHLFGVMSTNAGCTAFVGADLAARIYAGVIPQGKIVPAYVFNVITGSPENFIGEAASTDHELIQLDSWAADYDTATLMRDAARAAFEDQDVLIARSIGVKCVAFYPNAYEQDTKRFSRSIGLSFWTTR